MGAPDKDVRWPRVFEEMKAQAKSQASVERFDRLLKANDEAAERRFAAMAILDPKTRQRAMVLEQFVRLWPEWMRPLEPGSTWEEGSFGHAVRWVAFVGMKLAKRDETMAEYEGEYIAQKRTRKAFVDRLYPLLPYVRGGAMGGDGWDPEGHAHTLQPAPAPRTNYRDYYRALLVAAFDIGVDRQRYSKGAERAKTYLMYSRT